MKTITVIARQFGLSRSTLLYYDRIGLLSASYRTHAEARLYSAEEEARLRRIVTFRRAGIPLETIKVLLDSSVPAKVNVTLERRLAEIQEQIGGLRSQQRFIVEMLLQAVLRGEQPARTKDQWVALLKACAFTEADMHRWHVELERSDPEAHQRFLKRIGLKPEQIAHVRAQSQAALTGKNAISPKPSP